MASIRKSRKKWLAEVRLKSGYASKTFPTKLEAQAWAVAQEQSMGKRGGGLVRGKTLHDAFSRYAAEVSPTKKGERWEVIRLNKLCREPLACILLADLRTEDLNLWKNNALKRLQSASVKRELNLIASVLETARKQWKWIAHNPARDVDHPRNPPPRDRRISDLEITRILNALAYEEAEPVVTQRQVIAVAFLLALETAMRQGELWRLNWQHVHLTDRFVTLLDTKNGSKRDVPLSLRAVALFKKLTPHKGRVFKYPQASCATIFRRALAIAEIRDLRFHDTRHEALTRLAGKLSVLDLARMVGHRDPRSLMIYYNATASEIAQRLD